MRAGSRSPTPSGDGRILTIALLGVVLTLLWRGTVWAASSFPPHSGDSPWSFTVIEEPSSTFVVNDTDSSTIDTYLFRPEGPIVIDLPIRRYVGATDPNGFLLNVSDLVRRGIVGPTVNITLPAFDVDEHTFPVLDCDGDGIDDQLMPEVDKLYLNDDPLGTLKGDNNIWVSQSFSIPIAKLKFPSAPGDTAVNRFRVDIDTANENVTLSSGAVGCEVWAVEIDWIGIKFEASSPVIMVHGIRSAGDTFSNFKAGLEAEGIKANDNSISMTDPAAPNPIPPGCPDIPYNNTFKSHVDQLRSFVPLIAQRFGSESVHYVTHSKGGLDTRGFLSSTVSTPIQVQVGTMGGEPVMRDLEARSLVTLDTPHQGSVLANYGVEARQLNMFQALTNSLNAAAAKGLEGSYYCDLTPTRASAYVASTALPTGVQTASVASDADCNGNQHIESATICSAGRTESSGFQGSILAATLADRLYRVVGGVADVTITVTPRGRFLPDKITVTETRTASFQTNDVIVTQTSAGLYRRYAISGWHHLNVHSRDNAQTIARDAQGGGLVDWRRR
jgi:triacylglycerol esterase/lipase EstA (alpha/beta hydrolase family)